MSTTTKNKVFSTEKIAITAILTAISFLLYAVVKFNLPFIFPAFLEIQFSDMPALLGGFAWGPGVGCAVVILRCVLKMIFGMSSTACVGEFADILVGLAFVLPASLIYKKLKSKKGAVVSLVVGSATAVVCSIFANWLILIPFFVKAYGMDAIIGMVASLYSGVTADTFYNYYIPLATIPFNALRCFICSIITYFVYKPLSKALHWEFKPRKAKGESLQQAATSVQAYTTASVEETIALGKQIGQDLVGGQTVLLSGDLGAGKTHFTKGIALAMGVEDVVVSPTFAIHNVYHGTTLTLNHFDFYKIESVEEIANLGFDEIIGQKDAVSVMEWWQNVPQLVPSKRIEIEITVTGENTRQITVTHVE